MVCVRMCLTRARVAQGKSLPGRCALSLGSTAHERTGPLVESLHVSSATSRRASRVERNRPQRLAVLPPQVCSLSFPDMWHIPCESDRSLFASLVEVLRATENAGFLGQLSAKGVKSARDLENVPRSQLREIMGDVALDRLLQFQQARKPGRSDIPVVHPYARGSLQRIGLARTPNNNVVELDLSEADREFELDKFAKTSRAPRESRWQTWSAMAKKRELPPLPVTVERINGIGSLMKAGRYRSAAQYFSVAKAKHVEGGWDWSQQLDLARGQAIRSITRGMGPAAAKVDLMFDNIQDDFEERLLQAYNDLEVSLPLRVDEPAATSISATWFLLRGIEVANVKGADIRFNREERSITVRLPASKTDLEGKGCFRKHVCVCRPVHEHNCADKCSPAVMFTRLQKCSCRRGRHPLCVFHSLLALVVRQRLQGSYDPERPLFGRGSCPPTQRQLTQLARACAFALQKESLSEWSSAMLEKWSQHCFRVAGAQLFARAGIHLAVVQVIGRWGSLAILRYVQESVFVPGKTADQVRHALTGEQPSSSSSQVPAQAVNQAAVESIVRRVVAESWQSRAVFVHNTRTKVAHKPSECEQTLPSFDWISLCGRWFYGSSNHLRHVEVLPGFAKCAKCFPDVGGEQAIVQGPRRQSEASEESEESVSESS